MFQLPDHLWAPQRRGIEQTIAALGEVRRVCLQGPTGSGKTEQAIQFLKWAESRGCGGCFYINRRLLIPQTAARFDDAGLHYGIRAAEYEDRLDHDAPFQICSADTERSRVLDKKTWHLHDVRDGGVVIVDEAHIQKTATMAALIERHLKNGAFVVLLTATPIGLSKWADRLIVSGTLAEYRDCKAIVPCKMFTLQTPDLAKVQRNVTGEYILDGRKKKIYTQSIVGKVIESIPAYNPDLRPMILYAPGKPESAWFCTQLVNAGIRACHVDATEALLDGVRYPLTRTLWEDIAGEFRGGLIKCLCSRFKLREGIDFVEVYHEIFATPIGSLASYLQSIGRGLRYSDATPDHVIATDHGGNYLRHGSPNLDRDWHAFWNMPEHAVSHYHENQIRDRKEAESIVCPKCKLERRSGMSCPNCHHQHAKSQREVIMEDGTLELKDGDLIKPRRIEKRWNTQDIWKKMYFGWRHKCPDRTFAQMAGFFAHENHYHPPKDLNFMPIKAEDWHVGVGRVDVQKLRGYDTVAA